MKNYKLILLSLILLSCLDKKKDILATEEKKEVVSKLKTAKTSNIETIEYDSLNLIRYESISKFYVLNSEDSSSVDSVINVYKELISKDSLFKPVYQSLITVYQKEGDYYKALDLIERFIQLNSEKNNYSFYYQKSLTLMCIDGKEKEGGEIMNELWKKMKEDDELNEVNLTLLLMISKILNKDEELEKVKKKLNTEFNIDILLINSMVNSSDLEYILPCKRIW